MTGARSSRPCRLAALRPAPSFRLAISARCPGDAGGLPCADRRASIGRRESSYPARPVQPSKLTHPVRPLRSHLPLSCVPLTRCEHPSRSRSGVQVVADPLPWCARGAHQCCSHATISTQFRTCVDVGACSPGKLPAQICPKCRLCRYFGVYQYDHVVWSY